MTISSLYSNQPRMTEMSAVKPNTSESLSVEKAQSAQPEVKQESAANTETVQPEMLKQWQEQLQAQRQLEFSIDEDSGRNVVKVIDGVSGDIIRQFPTEEVLKLSRVAAEGKGGLFAEEA